VSDIQYLKEIIRYGRLGGTRGLNQNICARHTMTIAAKVDDIDKMRLSVVEQIGRLILSATKLENLAHMWFACFPGC
jgi:hypothetical protein